MRNRLVVSLTVLLIATAFLSAFAQGTRQETRFIEKNGFKMGLKANPEIAANPTLLEFFDEITAILEKKFTPQCEIYFRGRGEKKPNSDEWKNAILLGYSERTDFQPLMEILVVVPPETFSAERQKLLVESIIDRLITIIKCPLKSP